MRHFQQLRATEVEQLFQIPPAEFTRTAHREKLARALGATLYTPATTPDLAQRVQRCADGGVTSMVLCLEDAVPDDALADAEHNLIDALTRLAGSSDRPLLFVRVRTPAQLSDIADRLGDALGVLSGFVLPKFSPDNGEAYLHALIQAEKTHRHQLFCMPVLESAAIAYGESRGPALNWIRRTLRAHRDRVLAIRLGATDLSGLYGLRRQPDFTIYDLRVVAAVLADIVNYLGRAEDGFVITGPVWEYFTPGERIFRPRLRESLFAESDALDLRTQLLRRDMDGLIREVELDKTNGILGKTVIHPTHVPIVHSLLVVTAEEYADALDIVAAAGGGVSRSKASNKMNEAKPHLEWARQTLGRAELFGVSRDEIGFVDILAASMSW